MTELLMTRKIRFHCVFDEILRNIPLECEEIDPYDSCILLCSFVDPTFSQQCEQRRASLLDLGQCMKPENDDEGAYSKPPERISSSWIKP
jgi:hypothetical protein